MKDGKLIKSLVLLFALVCISDSTAYSLARTWRVMEDGTGDAPTIQAAIDSAAASGDLILVEPGTYYEAEISFNGKDIWLKSTSGPAVTTIDGQEAEVSVFRIDSGESQGAIIDGFTITGGHGGDYIGYCSELVPGLYLAGTATLLAGGAIGIVDSSPAIRNNVFYRNRAAGASGGFGGAIFITRCEDFFGSDTIVIENNLFLENESSSNGGAVAIGSANVVIQDNVFTKNYAAPGDGGAIWIHNAISGRIDMRGNQFWENEAHDHGGAIEYSNDRSGITLEYNLFVRNVASGLDAPSDNGTGGALSLRPGYGSIRNNTFIDNDGSATGTGGAILLANLTGQFTTIESNVFYGSLGYAIRCNNIRGGGSESGLTVANNLFSNNSPGDIDDVALCLSGWQELNYFGNPLFCGPEADNFTVSIDSPALANGVAIGAFLSPGCGAGVPVERTTWGEIKARFHNRN